MIITEAYKRTLKPVAMIHGSSFTLFPKPLPKVKKTMIDYARAKNKRLIVVGSTKKKSKPVIPKEKTRWQLIKILDGMVSNHVLVKVCKGKCKRCEKQHFQHTNSKGELKWDNYGCSHYWARDYMGARFEEDNLDGLCWWPCHGQKWEHDKNGQYHDYMLKKLGIKSYNKLKIKAQAITKFSIGDIKLLIANFDKIWK